MTLPRLTLGLAVLLAGLTTTLAAPTTPPTSAPATTTSTTATTSAPTTNKVTLAGLTDHATRIVYIVDHSGSLLDILDLIRRTTKKSVDNLSPNQRFTVIVIVDGGGFTLMPDKRLLPATTQTKNDLAKALDDFHGLGASGDLFTDYEDAFKNAFALNPDVIFFLTDCHFDPRLIGVVTDLNRKKKVRVHTAAIINNDSTYFEQLQKIAHDNGGQYHFVAEKDLPSK